MTTHSIPDSTLADVPASYHERVARGAALLDASVPDWVEKIDLGELHLASTCDCILGQLGGHSAGSYVKMLGLLDLGAGGVESEVDYGFDISYHDRLDGTAYSEQAFDWLDIAWTDLINERRKRP